MKTLSTILAALGLLVGQQMSNAASGTVPSTGTGGVNGGLSNAYAFSGGFTVTQNTNVALNPAISNLVVAPAFTNANQVWSNVVVVNPTGNVLTNGILLTNAVKYAATLASASRPVLVRIMPGTYGTPTNTLPSVMWATDNVSTYWEPGAVWWSGTADGDVAWMFDDQTAARTNCAVLGYGRFFVTNANVNVFYTDKESRIRFECLSMYATDGVVGNTTASPFTWGSVTNEMDVTVYDYMESADYDAFYGDLAAGQRLRLKARTVRTIGDIFEFSSDSPQWGNVILDIDRAEQTATTGQSSFLQMAGRVHARIGQIKVASTVSSMAANGATNGILQGTIIELPANGSRSVLQDNSGGSWHTGIWLRDCVIVGPTNVDALTLTNIATVPTILENTTIRPGWASTNWARGATPSNVKIVGGFNLDPYKPLGSQVTVISTNYLPAIRNTGTLVQHGLSYFSNDVTIAGAGLTVGLDVNVSGGVYSDVGVFSNITAAIQFNVPNGAGPYTPADGDLYFDNNYWASGRGAFVAWDGTANVVIPMILQSDTPSNGQVPTWNTGGTWTMETITGGSGGTNFPPVISVITNITVGSGVRQSVTLTTSSNQYFVFTNSPLNGETIEMAVTNSASTNIAMTMVLNTAGTPAVANFYDPTVASNTTSFAVAAGSMRIVEFKYSTNNGAIWRLNDTLGKQMELAVASAGANGFLTILTNAAGSIGTVSNSYIPQASSMLLSNLHSLGSAAYTNTLLISKFATNAAWNINVPLGGSVNAVTNTLGGSAANLWITNVVDGGFFVARVLVDSSSRLISVTNASGLTLKVISTNGFAVTTLPQVYVGASKIATICGRAWVVAGTTNVDLWANVEQ